MRTAHFALAAAVIGFLGLAGCGPEPTSAGQQQDPIRPSFSGGPSISSGTVVVKPSSMSGWLLALESTAGGTGGFTSGPLGQPLGSGSAQLTVAGAQGYILALPDVYGGTRLDQLQLSYSTYRQTADAGNNLAIALQFNLDHDVTSLTDGVTPGTPAVATPDGNEDFQGRLVFEPYLTFSGGIPQNTWQQWDADQGKWWRTTNSLTRSTLPYSTDCLQANPCTITEILTKWPNAGISEAFDAVVLKAGSGWTSFTGNVDQLVIEVAGSATTYDFEPETPCTTTCYVNGTTGDDAFGGDTPTTAKKTIQAAVTQVGSGGAVIVAAGSYAENVVIAKDNLTLDGAGIGSTVLQGTCSATTTGIEITGNRTGLTISDLSITGYTYGIRISPSGGTAANMSFTDMSVSGNCIHGIWGQSFTTTNMAFTRVTASSNNAGGGASGRGLWLINGTKSNISVVDGNYSNNGLVGIDLSDGNATGVTITGNTVAGNGDAGIGVLGAMGPGANLVSGNTVTNNGRYGVEVKIPTGTGLASGAGSVVVSGNTVSRNVGATDARDYAGIAVFRRSVSSLNADQPTGVVVTGNTVSGYHRRLSGSTGDGFGIVVEGTGHSVTKNVVSDNDIGIQIQDGNTADVQSTPFFDRGNATPSSALINRNDLAGNLTAALRNVGAPETDGTCNWFGAATGPTAGQVVGSLVTSPWLTSSNLNEVCPVPADTEPPVVSNVSVSPNPAPYTTTSFALTATATDNIAVTSASYTINGGSSVAFVFTAGSSVSLSATLGPQAVGVYEICVTASDAAANVSNTECTMLAVYDPNAGFVTGGGWITSPAGAFAADPLLTGKATFGFVSKYVKGKTLPTGNTEFQFKAGNLNFSSTAYEWLVVSGARAQYKGSGTINGSGDYRFLLTAIDGDLPGGGGADKFRIRIWNNAGGGLVYDNMLNAPDSADPTTTLGGGSIVIHVPKK